MYAAKQIAPVDAELAEEWTRDIADPHVSSVQGIDAHKWNADTPWRWRITVSAMELVRGEPLEATLRAEIVAALRGVPGVVQAEEDDREVWIVRGEPTGAALVNAVAAVIDSHAEEIRHEVGL
jgi:hypothetical protein